MEKIFNNAKKPAPKWFRKFKKIWSNTENTVIAILLIMGYTAEAPLLLIIKLSSSYILNNLDTLLANGDDYVSNQNKEDEKIN